jgi:prepilin-type processing-associated H-X9-DG protein
MVVIAIIALLVAILLPSLQSSRAHAKSAACGANMHHVGLAMANYLFSSRNIYPPSYVYPSDQDGSWSLRDQSESRAFGYMHWSHFMYDEGQVNDKAFQCPSMEHGGAPRTNPGPRPQDWEAEQVDQAGQRGSAEPIDKQAPRLAYTANAVIMPRNKFSTALSGGQRINLLVRENQIKHPGNTILATEFLDNWKALGVRSGDGIESKSHRPINPFWHVGGGYNEYGTPPINPGFMYGTSTDQETYGLLPLESVRERENILDYRSGVAQINAIGRHHPTANAVYRKKFGGSANYLFADAHAENMTILDSMDKRKWGDAYYAINGESKILNMTRISRGN